GPDGTVGIVDRALRMRAVRATASGWQAIAATVPSDPPRAPPSAECPIVMLPERGGAARIAYVFQALAVDRAARIEATVRQGETRIVARAGSERSPHPIPPSLQQPRVAISDDGSRALVVPPHGPVLWWQSDTGQWREEPVHFDTPTLDRARLNP